MSKYDDASFLAVSNTFTLPKRLVEEDLSIGAKATFMAIARHCDDGDPATMNEIVDSLGKSKSTVSRYVNELESEGWLDFVQESVTSERLYAVARDLPIYKAPEAARDTKWSSQERVQSDESQDLTQFVMDTLKSAGIEPNHSSAMQICMRLANSDLEQDEYRKYLVDDVTNLAQRVDSGDLREQQAMGYIATQRNIEFWRGDNKSKQESSGVEGTDWSSLEKREG